MTYGALGTALADLSRRQCGTAGVGRVQLAGILGGSVARMSLRTRRELWHRVRRLLFICSGARDPRAQLLLRRPPTAMP